MGHNESSTKRKIHGSWFLQKETGKTNNLTAQLKALEQKEANTPKRSRWQEIIKLRAEINQVKTKRTMQRINQTRSWVFEKNQQDR